jgi:hypothetical protein
MFSKQSAGQFMTGRQVVMTVMMAFGVIFIIVGIIAVVMANSPTAITFLTCGTGLTAISAFFLIIYRKAARKDNA